jgi:hypothetical protein
MSDKTLEVRESKKPGYVLSLNGDELQVPSGWILLAPGDAALSRRVKKAGPSWTVKKVKGRKLFSKGIWAPEQSINTLRNILASEREQPTYKKNLAASRHRRNQQQERYTLEFHAAIQQFLNFAYCYDNEEDRLATLVTQHAIPVGSATVARTKSIPIEQRAELAVIAWMRHQTTLYDTMKIPRVRGKRREIRSVLAKHSRALLKKYRAGDPIDLSKCPLYQAIEHTVID